jgi:hypothetical protein
MIHRPENMKTTKKYEPLGWRGSCPKHVLGRSVNANLGVGQQQLVEIVHDLGVLRKQVFDVLAGLKLGISLKYRRSDCQKCATEAHLLKLRRPNARGSASYSPEAWSISRRTQGAERGAIGFSNGCEFGGFIENRNEFFSQGPTGISFHLYDPPGRSGLA